MSTPEKKKRNRFAFRPAVTESRLEERLVLSSASYNVYLMTPPTAVAPAGTTPAPAPSPVSAAAARRASRPLTVARLHTAYRQQVHAATRDLRAAIRSQLGQLYANGGTPTAQQMANFNASIAGALDATALRLSTQASLLPNSSARLVPAIQNALLGSGPRSFTSRLESLASSGKLIRSTGAISPALTRLTNTSTGQNVGLINGFFNSTPVNRLSVNGSGQRIPLEQFLGGRLLSQVGNTLGLLASSFPSVANSMLFPNGTSVAPTQAAMNAFTTQLGNALNTAAFQLGSGLALFPNSSSLISQINPLLFGSTTGNIGVNGTAGPGSITATNGTTQALGLGGLGGGAFSSLASALQNLQFGSPTFNTAVGNAFGSAFSNLVTPISQFFGLTGQLNTTLPTTGFTSLFGTPFTGNSFFNGFNNGFLTGTSPGFLGSGSSPIGFIGFGMTPTGFNNSFGTGFNNFVSTFNQGLGLGASNLALGAGSGVNGVGTGLINSGIGPGLTSSGVGSGTITGTGTGISGTSLGGTGIGIGIA